MTTPLYLASLHLFCAGFIIAAPIGPVAFLIFRRILQNHFSLAFLSGIGAVLADTTLGFAALMGAQWVRHFFETYHMICRLSGGFFLIIFGLFLVYYPSQPKARHFSNHPLLAFGSGFLITLFNPLTFAAFLAAFSILHIHTLDGSLQTKGWLLLSLCAGASTWWTSLSLLALWGKKWLGLSEIARLNKWISYLLIVCGLGTLLHTVFISIADS